MSNLDDVTAFLETWQSTLQEVAISGCSFTNAHQVNFLLGALPESWSAFVTTQGGLPDLTFTNLLSNILQQNSINTSKQATPSAFYAKGKFTKPTASKSSQSSFRPSHYNKLNFLPSNKRFPSQRPIVCHYCGKLGHKARECQKKQ
jgi:hypothetical protein